MKMDSKFEDEMIDGMHGMYEEDKEGKMMTMEDVAEQLMENFADEIADSKEYFHMAKIADKFGDLEDCHYLTEMAKDEYTHAYFIHSFMMEHDMCIPEDHEKEFECLTNMMKDLFR